MRHGTPVQAYSAVLRALGDCGFQPVGATITQGSGLRGRALSADGTVWIDLTVSHSSFRRGLRRFFRDGRLRHSEITLALHTELNNGSCLSSRADSMQPATELGLHLLAPETLALAAAHKHMRALETHLHDHSPLKPVILLDIGEVLDAERRIRQRSLRAAPAYPLSLEALHQLGVAPHLARLIAGPCADNRETLPI
jgi:hypothetical protein